MSSQPRNVNLILRRHDGKRRNVGSVVVKGAIPLFKTWATDAYLHQNNNALGINVVVLEHLKSWRVKDVYFLLGSGHGKQRYRTSIADLERLGTPTNAAEGWGWNLSLPVEQWARDRSTFDLGYVPNGQDLVLEVPLRPAKPVAELPEKLTTRREQEPEQLGMDLWRVA